MAMRIFKILVTVGQLAAAAAAANLASGCAVYMAADGSAGGEPSTARAIGHGVMDVLTFGVWEIVGTPIELVVQKSDPAKPEPADTATASEDTQ